MNQTILTGILIFFVFCAQSQNVIEDIKFGKVPDEYIQMQYSDIDSSAEAMVILDHGETSIDYMSGQGWELVFQRHLIIKIFNEDGLSWADHEIPYYAYKNTEQIPRIKGFTYNGTEKVKLKNDNIFREETNEYWSKVKITMPSVRSGSVVELLYELRSDRLFNFRSWEFQTSIPTTASIYETKIPEYFSYRKLSQGFYPFTVNDESVESSTILLKATTQQDSWSGKSQVKNSSTVSVTNNKHTLGAFNVPAMRNEDYISSINNYVLKVDYELQSTNFPGAAIKEYRNSWESLDEEFMDHPSFGKALNGNQFLKPIVSEIESSSISDEQKIVKAFDHIRSKVKWNSFTSKYVNVSLRNAYNEGQGNCADINLMLTALLRNLGLNANPVLMSTRTNGRVRENFSMSGQFNYVICSVELGDGIVLLDATDRVLPIGYLPLRARNGRGRIISEKGSKWVSLENSNGLNSSTQLDLRFTDDMSLEGELITKKQDYSSFQSKARILQKDSSYIEDLKGKHKGYFDILNYEREDFDNLDDPLTESFQVKVKSDQFSSVGNLVFFKPMFQFGIEQNPFKNEFRSYPVDYNYPVKNINTLILTIPENMAVEEVPEPTSIALPDRKGTFIFNTAINGNTINVTSMLIINGTIFTSQEYPYLREFYSQIVEKHAEQIVLKKI